MIEVSEWALIRRINRRIGGYDAKTYTVWGERLSKPRGYFSPWGGGDHAYCITELDRNIITGALQRRSDLETFGREVGALASYETLAE